MISKVLLYQAPEQTAGDAAEDYVVAAVGAALAGDVDAGVAVSQVRQVLVAAVRHGNDVAALVQAHRRNAVVVATVAALRENDGAPDPRMRQGIDLRPAALEIPEFPIEPAGIELLSGIESPDHGIEELLPADLVIRLNQAVPIAIGIVAKMRGIAPHADYGAGVHLVVVLFPGSPAPAARIADPIFQRELPTCLHCGDERIARNTESTIP